MPFNAEVQGSVQVVENNTQWTGTNRFTDSQLTIVDEADATKQLKFQVSGVTTGTTATLTVPSASATLAGTASPTFTGSLTVTSTTGGVRVPNMTGTQRDAIATPGAGTIIYNTSSGKLNVFTTAWEEITSAA